MFRNIICIQKNTKVLVLGIIFLLSIDTSEPGFVLPKIKEPCSKLPLNSIPYKF